MIESPHAIMATLFPFEKIWVGLSGGLDSVALLHFLAQFPDLKPKLHAVHVNHGLSLHAQEWQDFCSKLCQLWGVPLNTASVNIQSSANIEALARTARYQVFLETVATDVLVLAHHLDDQIETFFLNALRGSGIDGLAAMPKLYNRSGMTVFRPLLDVERAEIKNYATWHQLSWVEDDSNADIKFSRNFLRAKVLPLLADKWPNYRKNVMHTIKSCQEVYEYFYEDITPDTLDISQLRGKKSLERHICLRQWFKGHNISAPNRNIIKQIEGQMIYDRRQDSNPRIQWNGCSIYAYNNKLYLIKELPHETGDIREALKHLDISNSDVIEVRYRSGGEILFWRGHHRCLKKLMQEWKIPPFLRSKIPLIYINGIFKGVVGYTI